MSMSILLASAVSASSFLFAMSFLLLRVYFSIFTPEVSGFQLFFVSVDSSPFLAVD